MGLIPNAAQAWMLGLVADELDLDSELRLFSNDYTPVLGSVLADFTEATFPGYAAEDLAALWSLPVLNGAGKYEITPGQIIFTASGGSPQTVYGYYAVWAGTTVVAARRLDSPVVMANSGDEIRVTARVTLNEE